MTYLLQRKHTYKTGVCFCGSDSLHNENDTHTVG